MLLLELLLVALQQVVQQVLFLVTLQELALQQVQLEAQLVEL
jgi:hypothetical protein